MPETFVTWEEQINKFTFDEEKVKHVKEKKQVSCCAKQGLTFAWFLSSKISDTFQ